MSDPKTSPTDPTSAESLGDEVDDELEAVSSAPTRQDVHQAEAEQGDKSATTRDLADEVLTGEGYGAELRSLRQAADRQASRDR